MKINMTTVLKNWDGTPIRPAAYDVASIQDLGKVLQTQEELAIMSKVIDAGKIIVANKLGDPLTLKTVCLNVLGGAFEDEKTLDQEEKLKRHWLAMSMIKNKEVDLGVDDCSLLMKLINKAYSTLVVGRASELLDPKNPKGS